VLVHGVLRDEAELEFMKQLGVELIPYKRVLEELRDDRGTHSSSIASSIADILRFME
jgi:hypothetical protein